MAWGDLTNSQMVSYVEASTSPFSLVPGQSHFTTTPAANQCMTKANALGRYVLNSSYMSSYADNQLVPKSTWIPGVSYPYTFYAQDATSSSESCAVSGSTFTLYSADNPLVVYSRLYTDINLTNTFYAGEIQGDWFKGTDERTYRMQNYWDPESTYDPKIAEIASCGPFTYLAGVSGSGSGLDSSVPYTTTFQSYGDGGSSAAQYIRMNNPGDYQRVQLYSPIIGLDDGAYIYQGTYPNGPWTYRGQAFAYFAADFYLPNGRDLYIYVDVQRGDQSTLYEKITYLYLYDD